MAGLQIDIDITGYLKQVDQARSRDIPFATAKALTRTAQDAQIEVKRDITRLFTLRNSWTVDNIRITPAQKLSWPITAEVYTSTANSATGAPDYLVRQEDGGERIPFGGRTYFAIPTSFLRQLAGGDRSPIPPALRPRALLELAQTDGKYTNRKGKLSRQSTLTREYYFFKVIFKSGAPGIMARHVNDTRGAAVPLYVFVTSANIRKRLNMQQQVEQIAAERFSVHWDDAWDAIGG